MANPIKGEVSFEVDGERYTFVLGTLGLAALERRTKVPSHKFFSRKNDDWGVDDLLSVFYAGLLRKHNMTEVQVADMMDRCGFERLGAVLTESMQLGGLGGEPGGEATSNANPQETAKANGIGAVS